MIWFLLAAWICCSLAFLAGALWAAGRAYEDGAMDEAFKNCEAQGLIRVRHGRVELTPLGEQLRKSRHG
jgi:hypothetical protein